MTRQGLHDYAGRYGVDIEAIRGRMFSPKSRLWKIKNPAGKRGAIFYAVAKSRGRARAAAKMLGIAESTARYHASKHGISMMKARGAFQRDRLRRAFIEAGGSVAHAGKILGLRHNSTFYTLLKQNKMSVSELRHSLNLPRSDKPKRERALVKLLNKRRAG